MIEDNPQWRVFMNLMSGLYANHPIRTGVAGTVESISHITADTLYACHKAFYNPVNMVLCVAGNVVPERVCDIAREILPREAGEQTQRDHGQTEPEQVSVSRTELHMDVSTPIFLIGYKGDGVTNGPETLRLQLLGELTAQALAGPSTAVYAALYEQGLVNSEFECGFELYPGCAFLYAGGESRDPDEVALRLQQEADRLVREGIDPSLWERLKKAAYGNRVRQMNSFENLCVGQAQNFFLGADALAFPEVFASLTAEDARQMLERWVTRERTALSVVQPKEGA